MKRWLRRRHRNDGTPLVSVVVPVFNNVAHVGAALQSMLGQPQAAIEVVVVDDGSTDGTGEVVARIAARDPRVRLLTQANAGVSIARNNAIEHCRGRFLTFADGDDVLPPDAWTPMLRALDRTGSDFAVGKAEREEITAAGSRRFVTPLMRRNHEAERLRTTVREMPLLLADVFVWNKIFRTDFYRGAGIHFPERTRYQDQVAMTQAFLAARSVDVLTDVVYTWRVRPEGNSATQRRAELSNLRERFATKQMTHDLVRRHGDARMLEVLRDEVLPIDLWEHFRASVRGDDDYWATLVDGVRALWPLDGPGRPFEQTRVPAQQRLMGWLVVRDRRDDLVRWIGELDDAGPRLDGDVLMHPWADEITVTRPV